MCKDCLAQLPKTCALGEKGNKMAVRYDQGDLDGLCGMYALVNGVHSLMQSPSDMRDGEDELFQVVAKALKPSDYPKVLWDGTNFGQLKKMSKSLASHLEYVFEGKAKFEVRQVFKGESFKKISEFISIAQKRFDRQFDIMILGINYYPEGGHWTSIRGFDDDGIRIVDSSPQRKLRRAELTLSTPTRRRVQIDPEEILRIRLTHWEGERIEHENP